MLNKINAKLIIISTILSSFIFQSCTTFKIGAGPTIDTEGRAGVEAGITLGLGIPVAGKSAVYVGQTHSIGKYPYGKTGKVSVGFLNMDLAFLPDGETFGHEAGISFGMLPVTEYKSDILFSASVKYSLLKVLKYRQEYDHSKYPLFFTSMQSWTSAGFDAKITHVFPKKNYPGMPYDYFYAGLSLEYHSIAR